LSLTVPSTSAASEKRFQHYIDLLADILGHADRREPLRLYTTGLLLPGERKSVEPMAARLDPRHVRSRHQSLHHFVADADWDDAAVLVAVRDYALPALQKQGPLQAWIVDDTGIPKKGKHSVGVAHQYCGQLGKQANCQVAVSLSVASNMASLPIAYRLYLPKDEAEDPTRRQKTGVPPEIRFQTKPEIALDQIRQAVADAVPRGTVLSDTAYGNHFGFRCELTQLGLLYVAGVESNTTVWRTGQAPQAIPVSHSRGRPHRRLPRQGEHQPVSVKELALSLPESAWRTVTWREGSSGTLRSRFARLRVVPAHHERGAPDEPRPEEWLLMEWPQDEPEPTKYWLSTLPKSWSMRALVDRAKLRWRVERDYQELKQELGLGHYEGRGGRGFHHHATLWLAAYGFLAAERAAFSPSGVGSGLRLKAPRVPKGFRPRGAADTPRTA
jgi:SRSO17 transposase